MAETSDNSGGVGNAIGAAIGVAGSYALGIAKSKRQWKYQQRAMDKQMEQNKALWDYQNAYNTPQQQMERLKAAGLNPYLVYGGSSAGAGNAGPIQPTDVPVQQAADTPDVPNMIDKYLTGRQRDVQWEATRQNIVNAQRKADLIEVQTSLENLKLMRENMRSKNYEYLNKAELQTQRAIADRTRNLANMASTQDTLMGQMYDFRQKQNPQLLKEKDLDNVFKNNRNELAKFGVYQSDHPIFRVLIQASQRMGISLDELLQQGPGKLQYLFNAFK